MRIVIACDLGEYGVRDIANGEQCIAMPQMSHGRRLSPVFSHAEFR